MHAEAGVRPDAHGLPGSAWVALEAALAHGSAAALRQAAAPHAAALRAPLRALLHYHLGHATLRTRQVWQGVQRLADDRTPMNPLVSPDQPERTGTALSVNVNKVALLRNTRHLGIPSVVHAATLCLQAGADGITVHPRPDERHIRAHDVHDIAALLKDWPQAEYNIEGNPFHNLMAFVREVRPQQATFVPDSEGQFTSRPRLGPGRRRRPAAAA